MRVCVLGRAADRPAVLATGDCSDLTYPRTIRSKWRCSARGSGRRVNRFEDSWLGTTDASPAPAGRMHRQRRGCQERD